MSESMEKAPVEEVTTVKEETSVKETSKKEATSSKDKDPKKKGFFSGVKSEFKRIIWPDKGTVARQTLAVVLVTIVLGVVIVVVDNLIQSGLNFIL